MTFPIETTINKSGEIIKELTTRQIDVLKLIHKNPNITIEGIPSALEVNPSAIQRHLKKLKDKGVIKRKGGTRGYWEIQLKVKKNS